MIPERIRRRSWVAGTLLCLCTLTAAILLFLPRIEVSGDVSPAPSPSKANGRAEGTALVPRADGPASNRESVVNAANVTPETSPQLTALARAKTNLADQATSALDGVMFVNEVLDNMLTIASLSIDTRPDYDYDDNDALAYRLKGAPEDMQARMLVGLQPYEENGRRFRYLQMDVDIGKGKAAYFRDSMRADANINLSISYDETDPNTPTRFGLMLQRRVDTAASQEAGIDADHGRYTTGAYYWIDLLVNPQECHTTTIGMIDGDAVDAERFGGVRPLAGDLALDKPILNALLEQLQLHQVTLRGQ